MTVYYYIIVKYMKLLQRLLEARGWLECPYNAASSQVRVIPNSGRGS